MKNQNYELLLKKVSVDVRTWLGVVEGIVCVLEVTVELKETGPQVK